MVTSGIGQRSALRLRGLTRLRTLVLSGEEAKDLAPLTSLTQLQVLVLSRCTGVADLAPLAGLAQLQGLGLGGCTGLSAKVGTAFQTKHPPTLVFTDNNLLK